MHRRAHRARHSQAAETASEMLKVLRKNTTQNSVSTKTFLKEEGKQTFQLNGLERTHRAHPAQTGKPEQARRARRDQKKLHFYKGTTSTRNRKHLSEWKRL